MPIKIFFKINLKTFHFFSMHGKTPEFLVWYPESGRTGFYGNISFVNQAKEAGPGGWVFPILLAGILTSILSNPAERQAGVGSPTSDEATEQDVELGLSRFQGTAYPPQPWDAS